MRHAKIGEREMYRDDILYYEDGEMIFEKDSIGEEFYILHSAPVFRVLNN